MVSSSGGLRAKRSSDTLPAASTVGKYREIVAPHVDSFDYFLEEVSSTVI
jgi:hypothetical protein